MASCDGHHHDHGHNHCHSHGGMHVHGPTSGKRLWLSLFVTLAFVAFEALAGLRAQSLALLSDAGHNLSDALALGLAAFALWLSRRPASASRTYGYHRATILTALFNAASLMVLALGIGWQALDRFWSPQPVVGDTMIWVAMIAVLMNTAIAVALSGDAKNSLNSRAAYVHMAGDAVSSAAVVLAGLVVHYTGWLYADPLVSCCIAFFIAYTGWDIVRHAVDVLLESTPRGLDVEALVASILDVSPVTGVHDLHIWTVGDGLRFLSCHVQVPSDLRISECADVVDAINHKLVHAYSIGHATIQVESDEHSNKSCGALYCSMQTHHHHHAEGDHSHSQPEMSASSR